MRLNFLPRHAPILTQHTCFSMKTQVFYYCASEKIMPQNQTALGTLRANAEVFFRGYGLSFSDGLNALLKDAMQQGKVSLLVDQDTDEGYIAE
jgi:hypothetical protein